MLEGPCVVVMIMMQITYWEGRGAYTNDINDGGSTDVKDRGNIHNRSWSFVSIRKKEAKPSKILIYDLDYMINFIGKQ